jgi:uncharacterized DUF497 family protein
VRSEWDPKKQEANLKKHGVSFEEAAKLFTSSVDYLELYDSTHSLDEERFIAIGPIRRGLVLVVYTERTDEMLRIISARWATPNELRLYTQYLKEIR